MIDGGFTKIEIIERVKSKTGIIILGVLLLILIVLASYKVQDYITKHKVNKQIENIGKTTKKHVETIDSIVNEETKNTHKIDSANNSIKDNANTTNTTVKEEQKYIKDIKQSLEVSFYKHGFIVEGINVPKD